MTQLTPLQLLRPLVLAVLGGVLLLVVSGGMWVVRNNVLMVEEHQRRDGHLIAAGLTNAVAPALVQRDYGALEERLLQTAGDPAVRSALVIDTEGQVLGFVQGHANDLPPHPLFDTTRISPPQVEEYLEERYPDFTHIWHIVRVGVDVGWVRLDLANDLYNGEITKSKREVLLLALVVAGVALFLLGTAIFRSLHLINLNNTETAQQQQRLENQAYFDALTKLPNRSLLYDRLSQAIARRERKQDLVVVGFIDLDNFKPVNDRHGHTMGDHVLAEVARRLQTCIRGDDTVARFGGDEFVVLLGDVQTAEEAEDVFLRLLAALESPLTVGRHAITIQASIGYVIYPRDCIDPNSLLTLSDQAMYRAKGLGGNRIYHYRSET